ncbi:transporter [Geobacillus subterraneus]|uniref:Transporter n=2 Tax=Geobacillus TaxID=129337 RepID=A0ABN4NGM0_9BACL|nr:MULTISPECIES: EamA family transporter RarD [Geobacillus]AMX83722.1 transporter [Geobacillus subterraneus]KZS24424.1 transporter [Geobacillus subterraneus]OXB87937.1 protein RarD [Geobacillus uzenensis]QIZ67662.1 EamA family transporter RarD [Geobacillus subterraneus]WPZ19856.1 EamA family transporter RarD [Geobacillus subterraneus]
MGHLSEEKQGILYTAASYLLWGVLPLYWKLLEARPALEILAHRIIWSFGFMVILLAATGRLAAWRQELGAMRRRPALAWGISAAALLISANWFIYIWAVTHHRIVEASLGYYINPLVSVALGTVVLRERLSAGQWIAFFLAAVGVAVMAVEYGSFPWVALSLALSFGFYGLVKKLASVDSSVGLTLETMAVMPISVIYLVWLYNETPALIGAAAWWQWVLLAGAGPATAVPLLYFAKGAQRVSMTMLGFLQYISPTISLLLGVFLFGEPFTKAHLYAFSCIWAALILFSIVQIRQAPERKKWKQNSLQA